MGTVGEKRKRIRIEKAVSVPDGQGGHTNSFALRAVVGVRQVMAVIETEA